MKCEHCERKAIGELGLYEIRAHFPFCEVHIESVRLEFMDWLKRTKDEPMAKTCGNCGEKYPATAWACYACSLRLDGLVQEENY